jgi:hypothetical protein
MVLCHEHCLSKLQRPVLVTAGGVALLPFRLGA